MDSGNSGSLQSSSGGDEEYDSRPDSMSSFLNSSSQFGSFSSPSLSLHHHHQQPPPPTFFDPPPHNLDVFSQSPASHGLNPVYNNPDLVWNNYAGIGNLPGLPSSSSSPSSLSLGPHGTNQGPLQNPPDNTNAGRDHRHPGPPNAVKNPKKRTRASRRAPTTVLTTDTTNFRQMVQEFTGIPAAPFSAGSPYSRRLDLFTAASAMKSGHLDTLGPLYPLRATSQKAQVSPYSNFPLPNSDAIESTAPPPIGMVNNSMTSSTATTSNVQNSFQIPSDFSFQKQPPFMMNIQNPFLSVQTLIHNPDLQHQPKQQLQNEPISLGNNQEQVAGSSERTLNLGHFDGNNNGNSHVRGFRLSEFDTEKGLENVASTRGEGTVDSWVCPSD